MNLGNLFFIPILTKALNSDNQILEIKKALTIISKSINNEKNNSLYKQFTAFIKCGLENSQIDIDELESRIVNGHLDEIHMDNKTLHADVSEIIKKYPSSFRKYQELKEKQITSNLEIEIYKDHNIFGSMQLDQNQKEMSFQGIEPDRYTIQLSNGRILWEGELGLADLKLSNEEISHEYILAAKSESNSFPPRIVEIIRDEVKMYIYPGLEFGRIKLVLI